MIVNVETLESCLKSYDFDYFQLIMSIDHKPTLLLFFSNKEGKISLGISGINNFLSKKEKSLKKMPLVTLKNNDLHIVVINLKEIILSFETYKIEFKKYNVLNDMSYSSLINIK